MAKARQVASFLLEELKQNSEYIRHIEELRLKHANIFLVVAGATISALAFLVQTSDSTLGQQTLNEIVNNYGIPISFGSGFLFLYGFFLCIFLSLQKRGYEHYRIVNAEIRKWFMTKTDGEDSFSFERELPKTRSVKEILTSTFFFWYLLTTLVSTSAFGIFGIVISSRLFPSWFFSHWVAASFVASVVTFLAEICVFVVVNRNIKTTVG